MQRNGYLLIADISGYTEFVKLHNLSQKPLIGKAVANLFAMHAEIVISDLLEAVIDAVEPSMQLNKLEGDAAFFFVDQNNSDDQADEIFRAMQRAHEAFEKKQNELAFVQACGCEPCLQSKNLRLKIFAHEGEYILKEIRQFLEVAGESVIFVHRLVKNGIESDEYWLVSEEFSKELSPENALHFNKVSQNIENFGAVTLDCFLHSSRFPRNEKIENRSRIRNWFSQAGYFSKATMKRMLPKNKNSTV